MIRIIEKKDYNQVIDLVYILNNTDVFYSGYCPKTKSKIEAEIEALISHKSALIYIEGNTIKAVLLYFESPNAEWDISGPFVLNESTSIAKALLDRFFIDHKNKPVNFFFTKKSDFYLKLMNEFNLTFSGYEYILKLYRSDFKSMNNQFSIRKAKKNELPIIQAMHKDIFGDVYVTQKMLAEEERFNQIYLLELDAQVTGYALLMIHETYAYLELFGLKEAYRGKGLSKSFLSKILDKAFENKDIEYCMLVVDKINITANKIYHDLGFKVIEENVSYKRY